MDNTGVQVDYENALINAGFGKFHFFLLAVSGMIYMNTAIGITIISFVLPSAACDFQMTSSDKGLLTAAPMMGKCRLAPIQIIRSHCQQISHRHQACCSVRISGAAWPTQRAGRWCWLQLFYLMASADCCHRWHNIIGYLCSFDFSMDLGMWCTMHVASPFDPADWTFVWNIFQGGRCNGHLFSILGRISTDQISREYSVLDGNVLDHWNHRIAWYATGKGEHTHKY